MAIDVSTAEVFGFDLDPVVIRKYIAGIQGGCVLDVDGYDQKEVRCGHLLIRNKANGSRKPLGVKDGAYEALSDGYEYEGVATTTVPTKEPFTGLMYSGEVNDLASPYPLTEDILKALKEAVPTLVFKHD
jgi:hypothetical protein